MSSHIVLLHHRTIIGTINNTSNSGGRKFFFCYCACNKKHNNCFWHRHTIQFAIINSQLLLCILSTWFLCENEQLLYFLYVLVPVYTQSGWWNTCFQFLPTELLVLLMVPIVAVIERPFNNHKLQKKITKIRLHNRVKNQGCIKKQNKTNLKSTSRSLNIVKIKLKKCNKCKRGNIVSKRVMVSTSSPCLHTGSHEACFQGSNWHVINNSPVLVQMINWCQTGDKPFSEPMMVKYNEAYRWFSARLQ